MNAMPGAVKIKAGKYGTAIGLLLERGGTFLTQYQRTLIVNAEQARLLADAGLIENAAPKKESGKRHGYKKDAG